MNNYNIIYIYIYSFSVGSFIGGIPSRTSHYWWTIPIHCWFISFLFVGQYCILHGYFKSHIGGSVVWTILQLLDFKLYSQYEGVCQTEGLRSSIMHNKVDSCSVVGYISLGKAPSGKMAIDGTCFSHKKRGHRSGIPQTLRLSGLGHVRSCPFN